MRYYLSLILLFIFQTFQVNSQSVSSFTAPDTVCINNSFNLTNTSTGASTYNWNFCATSLTGSPSGVNLGNPGSLGLPVFMDYIQENGYWYGLLVNNTPGGLVRLNFGNSLLNVPTSTYLGDFGGVIANSSQGVQIANQNGNIIAIIVGGDPVFGVSSRVIKMDFGNSITNTPTCTNWGNPGGLMNYPNDMYLFKESNIWYALTVNYFTDAITRLNFGTDFSAPPTAVNLPVNIDGSAGFFPLYDNGNWYVFAVNYDGNSLSRILFGSSLTNNPISSVNMGNIGGLLNQPRDIQLFNFCGKKFGFMTNGNTNQLLRLDFTSFTSTPTATQLGNVGNMSGPQSFSKVFRVGADIYSFVPNTQSNTITRLNFLNVCNTVNNPYSSLQTPPSISYSSPGTYTIMLNTNEGLPTYSTFCKEVVAIAPPAPSPTQNVQKCSSAPVKIGSAIRNATYLWNTGATTDSISVNALGTYWVESTRFGCSVRDSFVVRCIQASFTAPDTVCVNTPLTVTNTSVGTTTYSWNFCNSPLNASPTGVNLGNPGSLGGPVFMDYMQENGNWYALMVNNAPGGLVRLNFGNSLLNTPTSTYLGNFGGIVANSSQGVQIANNNGNIIAIIVGGDPVFGVSSRVIKMDFGNSITNVPTATNWGNVGGLMNYPNDLHLFKEGSNWYALTVNYFSDVLTRFNFGTDFSGTPTAVNLPVNIDGSAGFFPFYDNGNWYVFAANYDGNSMTRISFGSSLANTPVSSVNIGNIGGLLNKPRDIQLFNFCGMRFGYITNETSNQLLRLDFTSFTSVPTATLIGNVGDMNRPQSFTKPFRVGADVYAFVPNTGSNTITRLNFLNACTSASTTFSTLQNPAPVTYTTPGTYTIMLSTDEGTPEHSTTCKQIVVIAPPTHSPTQFIQRCATTPVKIGSSVKPATYTWSTGATTDSIMVSTSGIYWVESTRFGCSVRDSFDVTITALPVVSITNDTTVCGTTSVQLNATGGGSYLWSPATGLSSTNIPNPVATPSVTTEYKVTVTANGCETTDSVTITVNPLPVFAISPLAQTVCAGNPITITASGGTLYSWSPAAGITDPTQPSITLIPAASGNYSVNVTHQGCNVSQTLTASVQVNPVPVVTVTNDTTVCGTTAVQLNATGGGTYSWSPATGLSSTTIANPVATPAGTTKYKVNVTANGCQTVDSITIQVNPLPVFTVTPLSQSVCAGSPITITAAGGSSYAWTPAAGITNPALPAITLTPTTSGTYSVNVSHTGCNYSQTLTASVQVNPLPVVTVTKSSDVTCATPEAQLTATGGTTYQWTPAAGLSNPNIANPVASPMANTVYTVKVGTGAGCYAEKDITVNFLGTVGNTVYIPNAFTPNNDGLNDEFQAFFPGAKKFQMKLFNGWGEMIFETDDVNKGWNGLYKGRKQGTDVYVYIVSAETHCGGTIFRKGTFMLIR